MMRPVLQVWETLQTDLAAAMGRKRICQGGDVLLG